MNVKTMKTVKYTLTTPVNCLLDEVASLLSSLEREKSKEVSNNLTLMVNSLRDIRYDNKNASELECIKETINQKSEIIRNKMQEINIRLQECENLLEDYVDFVKSEERSEKKKKKEDCVDFVKSEEKKKKTKLQNFLKSGDYITVVDLHNYKNDRSRKGDMAKTFFNKKRERHRLDGPAIEWSGGTKFWHVDGIGIHKEDYPRAVKEYLETNA